MTDGAPYCEGCGFAGIATLRDGSKVRACVLTRKPLTNSPERPAGCAEAIAKALKDATAHDRRRSGDGVPNLGKERPQGTLRG